MSLTGCARLISLPNQPPTPINSAPKLALSDTLYRVLCSAGGRTREEGTVADSIEQARLARGGIALYGRREFARRHRCLCDGASVR